MDDLSIQLENISCRRVFPWLHLTRAFWIAVDPRKMLLAAAGLLLIFGGSRLFDALPFAAVLNGEELASGRNDDWPWQQTLGYDLWHGTDTLDELRVGLHDPWNMLKRIGMNWQVVLRPLVPFVEAATVLFRPDATWPALADAVLRLTWAVIVWAVFGGAISRIAAVQFAREENIGLRRALAFSLSKLPGYITAPFLTMAGIGVLWLLCVVGGWIGRIPAIGPVVVGLLWGLELLFGFLMAVVLIGLAAGWPLMFATISVEGSDGFDGLSRAFNYVFERPLYYLWQFVVTMLYGSVAVFVVWMMAQLAVHLATWGVAWGMGAERLSEVAAGLPTVVLPGALQNVVPTDRGAGTTLAGWWTNGWALLLHGFVHSFFWTSATIMYFLLRRSVDASDFDEVFTEEDAHADELLPLVGVAAGGATQPVQEAAPQGPVEAENENRPVDLAP